MDKISNWEELLAWSQRLPSLHIEAASARAALRVLPDAIEFKKNVGSLNACLQSFRAAFLSWASLSVPSRRLGEASRLAAGATYEDPMPTSAIAAVHKAVDAASSAPLDPHAAVRTIAYAAFPDETKEEKWAALLLDLSWLERKKHFNLSKLRAIAAQPLWKSYKPLAWDRSWHNVRKSLISQSQDFGFWVEWYDRRLLGDHRAFDIPGDKNRKEDKWLLRKLADATDEDFWDKGAEYVNTTLAGWLEEARKRAAKNLEESPPEAATDPALIPAQVKTALRFGQDEVGKIALAPAANLDALRTDQDARDRHETVVEDARLLLASCAGRNSAERLTAILRSYLEAAGESIETMRPSKFVQKGERLRQELARYDDPNTDLPPLPDSILNDLHSVSKAHNMVVGLDPALLELDTAQLAPDDVVGDVTQPELQIFAIEASEADILQEEAAETLVEAVELTPEGADASDRRFRWSASSCKNLVIEAFTVALNHPIKTAAVGTLSYTVGPAILVGNALACALFLVKRQQWVEEKLGRHAPTWKALFADLSDRLERTKNTP